MKEYGSISAIEQVADIKAGTISSEELLEYYIERVNRFNPDLNAIVHLDFESARKRAREADEALSRGQWWGPLHGLPITIKDTLEVAGMPCTSGSPGLRDHVPERNADIVQFLLDAGAIVFGKTNVPLLGGDIQTYNDVYGQSNNPWNLELTPGGSSGGAAAALAAGLCGLETGSDIGGSIRTPAHFCGIFGHKPSYGIVPIRGHIPPLPDPDANLTEYPKGVDIMVVGPLARSIDDISLMMDLLVAPEIPDRKAWKIELPSSRETKLSDFRIGLWPDDSECPVDRCVRDRFQKTVDAIAARGANLFEERPEISFRESHDVFLSMLAAAIGGGTPDKYFEKWLEDVKNLAPDDRSYQARHLRGATQLHRTWIETDAVRQKLRQKWADFFRNHDVLLCPAAPLPAIPHDQRFLYERSITVDGEKRPYMDMIAWAGLAGIAGLPSTVIPVGKTPEGLPVGMQIIGPYLEDRTSIMAGKLISEVIGGFTPPPAYFRS